jgi:flagellar hook-length control protein FliK
MDTAILFPAASLNAAGVKSLPAAVPGGESAKTQVGAFSQSMRFFSGEQKEENKTAPAGEEQETTLLSVPLLVNVPLMQNLPEEAPEELSADNSFVGAVKQADSALEALYSKAAALTELKSQPVKGLETARPDAALSAADKIPAKLPTAEFAASVQPQTAPLYQNAPKNPVDGRELFGDKLTVITRSYAAPKALPAETLLPVQTEETPPLKDMSAQTEENSLLKDVAARAEEKLPLKDLTAQAEEKPPLKDVAMRAEKTPLLPDAPAKISEETGKSAARNTGEPVDAVKNVLTERPAAVPLNAESGGQSGRDGLSQKREGPDFTSKDFSLSLREKSAAEEPLPQPHNAISLTADGPGRDFAAQKLEFSAKELPLDDAKALADHLVEQASLTQRPGSSELVIRLRPQSLGELTVRIVAENGGVVSAAFHSNNSEVRGILQESLPAIRQELSNSGLKVHDVGVYAGLGEFHSFTRQDRYRQDEAAVRTGKPLKLSDDERELLDELQTARGENRSTQGGVDYRI